MYDFDTIIQQFRDQELDICDWNFCTHNEGNGKYSAYIMGEGAEQCLARKHGFNSKQEVIDLFKSIGVNHILPGVG